MDLVELAGAPAQRHPWEVSRFRFFSRVLARAGLLSGGPDVLDVGAGDAWFARQLAAAMPPRARVVCWDTGYTDPMLDGGEVEAGPRVTLVRERPSGRFDLLLLLDVLEHVEDDARFLRTLVSESLPPGGHALVSVPAWQALFTSHDTHLRHHRRYAPRAARALLRGAGLELVASGGLFHALVLPRAVRALGERLLGPGRPPADLGRWDAPAAVTAVVLGALAWDNSLSSLAARLGLALPGLSFWALCRNPSR